MQVREGSFGTRGSPEVSDSAFVASRRGSVYYPRSCEAWTSLSPANLIWFADEGAARAAGYRRSGSSRCGWDGAHPNPGGGSEGRPMAGVLEDVCTVARIVDGDTLVCREGGERIRLLLVDAPELSQGEHGRFASDALADLLPLGTAARVERDVQERDRYRRVLAYLYDEDGRMVNEELARLGVVTVSVYPPNVRHVERIRSAVADARTAGRGLWSGSAFECTPADHRAGRCG
jgi:micrococcal nuclease